jgi:hypothetical protein
LSGHHVLAESASADEVRASSRRLLRFDKQEIFCRPFRAWKFIGRLTQGGARFTSLALGYHLSGFQPFNSCEFV